MQSEYQSMRVTKLEDLFAALEELLRRQIRCHEQLLDQLRRKREAIARADIDAMTQICQLENGLLQRLGDDEKIRLQIVGTLTERFSPHAKQPLTLNEIVSHAPGAHQSTMRDLAEKLRAIMKTVRQESSIITAAATALSRHLGGIMQMVYRTLSATGVYERRGRVDPGTQMEYCVDLKS